MKKTDCAFSWPGDDFCPGRLRKLCCSQQLHPPPGKIPPPAGTAPAAMPTPAPGIPMRSPRLQEILPPIDCDPWKSAFPPPITRLDRRPGHSAVDRLSVRILQRQHHCGPPIGRHPVRRRGCAGRPVLRRHQYDYPGPYAPSEYAGLSELSLLRPGGTEAALDTSPPSCLTMRRLRPWCSRRPPITASSI